MRLKFWFNAVDTLYDTSKNKTIPDHPVIKQIKYAIDKYRLPKLYFTRLIKSREQSYGLQFPTTESLERYAEESTSSIYYLLAKIGLDTKINRIKPTANGLEIDHALSHLGKSQGISNLLRAHMYQERSTALCMPQEILIKHGVSQERYLRDKAGDKEVQECTFEMASLAFSHLKMV